MFKLQIFCFQKTSQNIFVVGEQLLQKHKNTLRKQKNERKNEGVYSLDLIKNDQKELYGVNGKSFSLTHLFLPPKHKNLQQKYKKEYLHLRTPRKNLERVVGGL